MYTPAVLELTIACCIHTEKREKRSSIKEDTQRKPQTIVTSTVLEEERRSCGLDHVASKLATTEMSLTIKAFLLNRWGGDPLEIRRFTVDQDVTTSFTYLVQKIAQVFPSLRADDITVAWMGEQKHAVVSHIVCALL